MGKIIDFMKISIKASPVAIISSLSDASALYILSKETTLNLNQSIYISSIISILIAFIGNFYWTFNSQKTCSVKVNIIKFIKYIILQVILLIITSEITILLIDHINSQINIINIDKYSIISNFIEKDETNKLSLKDECNIIIKQCVLCVFYFMNVFVMKYIFK
jgi:putative flippase GtrA